ncbi:spore coat-associated protein camelysin [Wielerella bovis]|uniref:spore coat-associated protein camelysin n=1 Tax=Wielerella bovis TaxID=2917790 RepID=UPI002019573D|nr:spore coat-associated protein camelysin [Wielerella bovis]MCG7656447.1 spore coat-associated protein camelysin [Wielerella bovis]MCG7658672.1 spore coat-associated protein camelysin [Wielerella bovis]
MKPLLILSTLLILGGCVYAESPDGRFAALDLPMQTQTTVHKTVTVNAPAGTIVNISEPTPPTVIIREYPHRECYYDHYYQRRICR